MPSAPCSQNKISARAHPFFSKSSRDDFGPKVGRINLTHRATVSVGKITYCKCYPKYGNTATINLLHCIHTITVDGKILLLKTMRSNLDTLV